MPNIHIQPETREKLADLCNIERRSIVDEIDMLVDLRLEHIASTYGQNRPRSAPVERSEVHPVPDTPQTKGAQNDD